MKPNLLPAFIEQIKRELADPDPKTASLARALNEAAQGDAGARFSLRRALALGGEGTDLPKALTAAILCRDERAGAALLATLFGETISPELSLDGEESEAWPPVVTFRVVATGRIGFVFPASIYGAPHAPQMVQLFWSLLPIFKAFAESAAMRPGSARLCLTARPPEACLATGSNRADTILLPDLGFMSSGGYRVRRDNAARDAVAWADRAPVAFWCGAKDELALAAYAQAADSGRTEPMFEIRLGNPSQLTPRDWQSRRFLIDIDSGWSGSTGLFQKLLTGSTILRVPRRDPARLWLHDRLKPWVHYVPVAPDLSDLSQQIAWLLDHDATAQDIGRRGQEVALQASLDHEVARGAEAIAQAMMPPTA
jgi:hypothetical protein